MPAALARSVRLVSAYPLVCMQWRSAATIAARRSATLPLAAGEDFRGAGDFFDLLNIIQRHCLARSFENTTDRSIQNQRLLPLPVAMASQLISSQFRLGRGLPPTNRRASSGCVAASEKMAPKMLQALGRFAGAGWRKAERRIDLGGSRDGRECWASGTDAALPEQVRVKQGGCGVSCRSRRGQARQRNAGSANGGIAAGSVSPVKLK